MVVWWYQPDDQWLYLGKIPEFRFSRWTGHYKFIVIQQLLSWHPASAMSVLSVWLQVLQNCPVINTIQETDTLKVRLTMALFFVIFSRGVSSDSNIWPGLINPDYDYLFSSVHNNIYNYLKYVPICHYHIPKIKPPRLKCLKNKNCPQQTEFSRPKICSFPKVSADKRCPTKKVSTPN